MVTKQEKEGQAERQRKRKYGIFTILILTLIGSVILVVIFTTGLESRESKKGFMRDSFTHGSKQGDLECIDVAVIGAGIGGAYGSWRLRNRGMSISVFEYSDRVGGRMWSSELPVAPGIVLEFGAMRYKSWKHHRIVKTIQELGLQERRFHLNKDAFKDSLWYCRGIHLRDRDLGTRKMPYNLPDAELMAIDELKRHILSNQVNCSNCSTQHFEDLYSLVTTDGIPLYKMSIDNFFGRYTSREAYNYIVDVSAFAVSVGRRGILPHAIYSLDFKRAEPTSSREYKTVVGGMDKLPKTLMKKFLNSSHRHKLLLNHHLVAIEKARAGRYILTFKKTKTEHGITSSQGDGGLVLVCAKNIILAVQKDCLFHIKFKGFKHGQDIRKLFDIVEDYPVGKIFLAYNSSWWKSNYPDVRRTVSDLPIKQTYEWPSRPNVSIILASYHDGDVAKYWRELSQLGRPIPGSLPGARAVTDVVRKRLEMYMSLIYNVSKEDIPEPVGGGMMLWDEFPFDSGWSEPKPGITESHLRLTRRPFESESVYVASNEYAPEFLQSWSEGTLRLVDDIIDKYFK